MKMLQFKGATIAVLTLLTVFTGPIIVLYADTEEGKKDITFIDTLYSITMNGPLQIWTCGFNGVVYYSSDGGKKWIKQETGTNKTLFDIVFIENNNVITCGQGGTILRTNDGGQKWNKVETPTNISLFDISFADARIGCAVGDQGGILCTSDGGLNWREGEILEDPATEVADDLGDDEFDALLDEGESSENEFIIYGISLVDQSIGYAVGEFGTFLKTNDGGKTWTKFALDAAEGMSLFGVFAQSPERIWAVGIDGIMLLSENGGISWRRVDLPVKKHLFTVRFRGKNGYTVGKEGIYLKSADDGNTWEQINIGAKFYLQDIELCKHSGWIVGAHGWLLETQDGGNSFHIVRRAP